MKTGIAGVFVALFLSLSVCAQTNSLAVAKRFTRGVPSNVTAFNPFYYQSAVIPADEQRGIALNDTGNNANLFGNVADAQLPWFCRIQHSQRYHITGDQSGSLSYYQIDNPIAAFGELGGATPLYTNRDYRFGNFAGFRDYTNAGSPLRGIFRIRAYSAASLASGQTGVAHVDQTTFELPWPGDANWDQFLQNGATQTVTFHGLTTTVQIVGQAVQQGTAEQWNTWNDPFIVTHRASSSDYYFVVEYQGWTTAGANYPMVTNAFPVTASTVDFSPLYTLDFTSQPPWRSTFINSPQVTGEAVPSWYYGKSLQELQGAWSFNPNTPAAAMQNDKGAPYLDSYSPELRSHPILDDFVTSMGSDPIALANYVFNEIELADPVSYNENGTLDETAISCGGLNRGALATYLEGQGNPWEQCSLLVYLLRKANVPAVYCEPAHNTLGMLDTQLSKLLRMQIKGAQTMDGSTPMPTIVPTNYPWVAAYVPDVANPGQSKWVHLFPWLKDTEVIEGGNLYDQFPADTKTGSAWVRKYLQADSTIVPEQIAVYNQEANDAGHPNGLVAIEAEGFHEHVTKGGKRWEPLADLDENGTASPTGYSGTSWMRAMPNTGTSNTSAGFSSLSPRLDYQVNFTRTGTHYLWVRGQGANSNDNTVHVGLDGSEVTSASNVGSFGTTFGWKNTNTSSQILTVNVTSVGRHTINVWMRQDGFRFDKLLLTTSSTYNPASFASGNGPAVSQQTTVESNAPSNLFPRYARTYLGANTSFDSLGMQFRDRRYYRTQWDDFPKPFNLYSGTHQFYERLADRASTFDTVQVKLWSDRDGDGLYNSSTDGPILDTGEWLATDLHNRRLYTACRKTGTNTHQLRLYLGPYRTGATGVLGTGNFSGTNTSQQYPSTNPLQEQLLTANLTSADDKLQFEITDKRQKRAWKVGVVSIDVSSQGSGYTSAPSVAIAAPPAGTYNRTAVASAIVSAGKVTGFTIVDPGAGYTSVPTVTLAGGGGTGAVAKANLEDPTIRWINPLGVQVSQINTQTPQIRKGELAAICLNFGRVSDRMLRVHAEDFWQWERDLQATPSLSSNADFQEKTQSTSAYLMGMSYYSRVSKFKDTDERLHKARVFSMYAAGLSKLAPYRDPATATTSPTFGLPNSGDIVPRQATVDMFFLNAAYASNATVHADSGLPFAGATKDFWQLLIAEISAQEHAIINDYYKESAAISTVKLLHRAHALHVANGSQPDILRLTKANYASLGSQTYYYGTSGIGKTLSGTNPTTTWDVSMWNAITNAFNGAGGDYVEVYITPGPVASASAAYTGMGALLFASDQYSALISGNMNLSNGGSGSLWSAPYYSSAYLPSISLTSSSAGFSLAYQPPATSSNPIVAPAVTSLWDYGITASNLTLGAYAAPAFLTSSLTNNASLYGVPLTGNLGSYYTETTTRGSTGSPSYFGGVGGAAAIISGWVADPTNVVTGEFYIDATDLVLPGPFPLQIRRNYSSQALSDNDFGQGWKLAYFPYLVIGDNSLLYGAEMDGSVIAYRQDTQNANLYVPLPADNPALKNLHSGGAGSTANVLNNRITKNGTTYILTGPNGQTRTFVVQAFQVGAITRSRPYLNTWRDANGNTLTFTFNTDNSKPSYGLLKQVTANNGNFVGFTYDVYGHIVEAWTGDGRRVIYTYDAQGDLRTVTLPDGAVHGYDYQQETTTAGGESVQTSQHLLIRETKPNGRILENDYDAQRRVTQQRAVVGDTPAPVMNATFTYANAQNGDKTWTGTTTVQDAYNRPTVFSYTNSLITSEDDPETPAEVRDWYAANSVPGSNGAYPRSLKQITDRRGVVTFFKYDARGNLIEKSVGTDASPADLDGDGVASAGEKSVTGWTYTDGVTAPPLPSLPNTPANLPLTQTEPNGVITKWFYENASFPYLATTIEKWAPPTGGGAAQFVTKAVRAFTQQVGGTTSAYGLLQSERAAAGSADEAETDWLYDAHGYPTRQTRLTGTGDPAVVSNFIYNLRGELIQETDTLNRKSNYGYDAEGRRISSERRDGAGVLVAWDYTYYNLNGEPEWSDGPRYNPEDYVWRKYDGNGRRSEEIRWRSQAKGDGSGVEAPTGDALTSTAFSKYDLYNNLVEIREPRRNSIAMTYDGIGRMTQRDFYDGYKGGGGTLKASEMFQYEAGGQVSQQTNVLGGTTYLLYNARGQLRKRTNADGSVEEWRYYTDGRLYKEILRNGSYWQTTYDDLNRVVTRVLKASGGAVQKTQVKGYDRRGNCISETSDGFTFTKTYDDLDRLKTVTGPAATATSAQQTATYSYPDGAGRETDAVNGLNEKTITLRDALGRVESVEVRDAGNVAVRKTSYAYSADHHQVMVTEGTGAGAIVTQGWTDTFGKTVLTKKADGTAEYFFYDNGGLLTDHFDRSLRQTDYVRNWRGDVTQETQPGGVVVNYLPDVAGNILQRNMPGGLGEQAQYDSAGRAQWTKLTQGGGTTRLVNFAYYPTNHAQWPGLLNTVTDARGIVATFSYDAALRVLGVAGTGTDAVSRTLGYNERDMATSVAETSSNGTTLVTRGFDGYGGLSTESVSVGGTVQSSLTQYFDAAGRRWKLTGAGADRTFGYRADGLMTGTGINGNAYSASYADNGLLTGRSNPFRSVTVQARDTLGRMTDLRTTVGGVLALKETVPQWSNRDKIYGLYSERGAGAWNENRDYGYDNTGRLIYEDFTPYAAFGEDSLNFTYDGGAYGATGGVGVRTGDQRSSDGVFVHSVPGVATYARVTGENVGGSQPRSVPLAGAALGANKVALTLDGRDISPVTFPGWQDSQGNWSASALLAPGYHYLTATATHPSGWVAPPANSFFQMQARAETVTDGFDGMGNVSSRVWSGGKNQTLTWDGNGRLIKVVQTGVTPFTWMAWYDGLNRRVKTTYTPSGGATVTTNSIFDPQAEFLELGLAINGSWNWKVYGVDLSGSYGGLQGLGGLEAVIGSDGVTRGIVNDWFGNAAGYVAAPNAPMTWSSAQFLAWGPAPGWGTAPLDGSKPLYQLLGYRGLTLDPPGTIHMGLRDYAPEAGRWLSPDSLGHGASMSLYDFSGNDPLNVFDMDGRFGKATGGLDGDVYNAGASNVANQFQYSYSSLTDKYNSLDSFRGAVRQSFYQGAITETYNRAPITGVRAAADYLFDNYYAPAWTARNREVTAQADAYNAAFDKFYGSFGNVVGYAHAKALTFAASPVTEALGFNVTANVEYNGNGSMGLTWGAERVSSGQQATAIALFALPELTKLFQAARSGFSTWKLGYEVHQGFEESLHALYGTQSGDWFMRTAIGRTGVDAAYVGPAIRFPGFKYAELKPYSQNGISTFMKQLDRWNLPAGQTELFFYNSNAVIGSSGLRF